MTAGNVVIQLDRPQESPVDSLGGVDAPRESQRIGELQRVELEGASESSSLISDEVDATTRQPNDTAPEIRLAAWEAQRLVTIAEVRGETA